MLACFITPKYNSNIENHEHLKDYVTIFEELNKKSKIFEFYFLIYAMHDKVQQKILV
jgi:hypothetical protein